MASIVLLLTQILHPTNLEFSSSSSPMLLTSSHSSSPHYKSPRPTTLDTIKMSPLHEDPQDSRVMIDFF
ncbi:hypothetical protein IGI04_039237 [Brassica rapa subsp. trilocularis]|uniref:Uncharacterized protein n=3 Tax=Brassica TaxID=3705 RepID=A0A3P6D270_BRACM|nr:hypothetical protein IGI04_039237 [Brassica rapa subsp. trilocularis]CAF2307828.1 unnamed protein product [Brassica napus]CAG7908870.1 unnamed protein product [Brassica rapa]VDD16675.1 unnamed protein product [Brassica rapa]